MGETTCRPWWRWWLFCVAFEVGAAMGWRWAWRLMNWCILARWVASPEVMEALERAPPGWGDPPTLECPECGEQIQALRWVTDDPSHPAGAWLAYEDEEHTCPDCGWRLHVALTDEEEDARAFLLPLTCPHGLREHQACFECEVTCER